MTFSDDSVIAPIVPQAVLLDLDDTILDDSGGLIACWREACVEHCSTMNGLDHEDVFTAIDRVRDWYWSDPERHRIGRLELAWARGEVVRLALAEMGVDDPDLARRIGDTYHALRNQLIKPFDDAVSTVRWLRSQGCRLALLTNGGSQAQRDKINRFDLGSLFDSILVEGEVGFGKPDPRIYVRALDDLRVAPAETWMVGDNLEWDVAGPQREGIAGIWIDARGTGVPAGRLVRPDGIISRLAELRTLTVARTFERAHEARR
jgi:putative hydrolase of the HAD superfamily